jgi:succinate dehydrogenase / fumarate reductase flavoprotein subunit
LLIVAEAITRSAIERKESRGAQFREDFQSKDPEWAKYNVVVRRGSDGKMVVERVKIPDIPGELKQVIEENQ